MGTRPVESLARQISAQDPRARRNAALCLLHGGASARINDERFNKFPERSRANPSRLGRSIGASADEIIALAGMETGDIIRGERHAA
jgi:HAMP domain-containing protein